MCNQHAKDQCLDATLNEFSPTVAHESLDEALQCDQDGPNNSAQPASAVDVLFKTTTCLFRGRGAAMRLSNANDVLPEVGAPVHLDCRLPGAALAILRLRLPVRHLSTHVKCCEIHGSVSLLVVQLVTQHSHEAFFANIATKQTNVV